MTPVFEIIDDLPSASLASLWQDLEARAAPPFFLSWDWIGGWIETASIQPAILVGRVAGTVVLLAALMPATRRNALKQNIDGLHLHATGALARDIITVEYNGFMLATEWEGRIEFQAIQFLLSGVKVAGRRRDELHMKTASAPIDTAIVAAGVQFSEVQRKPSFRIDLATVRASGKAYLDTLSANTRQQIRRSMRLYEKRGPLLATRATNVDQALEWLSALGELHQNYWVPRGEPGAFAYPFFVAFQQHLLRTCLAKGTVELLRVSAGDDAIGYVYNFIYRSQVYAYLTGIRYEDDSKLKPGLVNHVLCIEAHLAEGAAIYDFMAGDNRYKANLGAPGPDMFYFVAQRPTFPLLLENKLRSLKNRFDRWRKPPVAPAPTND